MIIILSFLVLVVDLEPREQWYFFSEYEVPTYCSKYHNRFMDTLHKSLEYNCSENPKTTKCKFLLRRATYYSRMRSKWCYR